MLVFNFICSENMLLIEILLWMIIPLINFFVCYQLGYGSIELTQKINCPTLNNEINYNKNLRINNIINKKIERNLENNEHEIEVKSMSSSEFQHHRGLSLIFIIY